ncbi:prepilin peptidase [Microbacterium limosum]|uniref:Prepilin leader peptidase/N-methyltransferase n=1 Tax=Microbacterium limosum TaxID=3079935 RepID=A0AAU0MJS9_9MICO|nr:prepilin peptidase [Microbacterium sp. Y20]WOQ70420.1 prepilin peptidase [Microbacterium sp. Y20]
MSAAPALIAAYTVLAGAFGLVIGSFLNVVAYRVPAGIPLTRDSRCPACDGPVRAWQNVPIASWLALRGRCAGCRAPISARYPLVELVTALAFAAIAAASLASSALPVGATLIELVAYLYFAAVSVVLTLIDQDTRRLPNTIVLPSYLVALVLFAAAVSAGADPAALVRAVVAGLLLYLFYLVLRLARPDGMGGGDVKLAGVVGIYLGWLGWGAVAVGAFAAFVLGGVFGLALMTLRRAGRRTAIPFGPWMLAGAWIGIFAGEALARGYTGLLSI